MIRSGFAVAILCLLLGCSTDNTKDRGNSPRAFYYWQTSTGSFEWRDPKYKAMGVDRLYMRFFDVDWSEDAGEPVPVSPVDFHYDLSDSTDYVPVVFITNETFIHLDTAGAVKLARNVHRKIQVKLYELFEIADARNRYYEGKWENRTDPYRHLSPDFREHQRRDSAYAAVMRTVREIQFDCDWTATTRQTYFAFLREAKRLFSGKVISATIRLYQYRYPSKTGVPPVDRGMLMCYNAGNVRKEETVNSIFDRSEIMRYLENAKPYPVKLDYALPVFEWAVLYRQGLFKAILSAQTLHNEYGGHISIGHNGHAWIMDDFVYGYTNESILIRRDDVLRFEKPDMDDMARVAEWLGKHKNTKDAVLTFYHLNNHDFQEYSTAMEAMYSAF